MSLGAYFLNFHRLPPVFSAPVDSVAHREP